jgi:hypothetical protein
VEAQNPRNGDSAAKRWRDCHIKSGGIYICEFMQTQGRLVAIDAGRLVTPITGPEPPKNQVGTIRLWEERQPVNSAMLTEPVASLHMIGPLIAGISEGGGLLGREVPSLHFGDLV